MTRRLFLVCALPACAAAAAGEPLPVHTSLDAQSGLLRAPHAETLRAGDVALSFSDLAEPGLLSTERYGLAIGLFDRIELSGRLIEADTSSPTAPLIRDLSGGVKVQLFRKEGWPSLAVGAQDIHGNQLFRSYYAATSWSLAPFRLSLGHAWESESLRGVFGGIEWMPVSWLALIAEHTRERERVGARVTAPLFRGLSLSGTATADPEDFSESNFGIELAVPLARFAPRAAVHRAPAEETALEGAPAARPVELVLEPNLVTFIGTEEGVVDADLALRARVQVPFLRSGTVLVSLLTPSVHTDDFDDGELFERYRAQSGVDQGLLQWYDRLGPRWHVLTSGGHMRVLTKDAAILQQEHILYSREGDDSLRFNLGVFRDNERSRALGLLEVGHLFARFDTLLTVAGGRFAAGDAGGRIELTRFFGDATVTVFAKSAGDANESAAGLRFGLPLDAAFAGTGRWRVRGAERWTHSMQTTLGGGGSAGENPLRPDLLVEVLPDRNLRESYLDMDRATPAWAEAHGERLREPYGEPGAP